MGRKPLQLLLLDLHNPQFVTRKAMSIRLLKTHPLQTWVSATPSRTPRRAVVILRKTKGLPKRNPINKLRLAPLQTS